MKVAYNSAYRPTRKMRLFIGESFKHQQRSYIVDLTAVDSFRLIDVVY